MMPPVCPVCNERLGWIGVSGNFVCGECLTKLLEQRKQKVLEEMKESVHRMS